MTAYTLLTLVCLTQNISPLRIPPMSVEELESVVCNLSAQELARFSEWFEEFMAEQWDAQIEADILAGRFDAAGQRADDDFEAGRCTPL